MNYGKQAWIVSTIFVFDFGIKKTALHIVLSEVEGIFSTTEKFNETVMTCKTLRRLERFLIFFLLPSLPCS